jgi:hypothetical protein
MPVDILPWVWLGLRTIRSQPFESDSICKGGLIPKHLFGRTF